MNLKYPFFLLLFLVSFALSGEQFPFEESAYHAKEWSRGGVSLLTGQGDKQEIDHSSQWDHSLETAYYQLGKNNLYDGSHVLITDKSDFRIGRVKEQTVAIKWGWIWAASRSLLHSFSYEELKTSVHSGQLMEVYQFDGFGNLLKKEDFECLSTGEKVKYRELNFKWTAEKKLESFQLKNNQDQLLVTHTFAYDQIGNQISHKVRGDLTGRGDSDEVWEQKRSYNDRGLCEKEWESGQSLSTHYQYDLRSKKSLSVIRKNNQQIIWRQFFKYNEKGLLSSSVEDDGNSSEEDSLQGITQRKIQRYSYNDQGQKIKRELSFYDPVLGVEVISQGKCWIYGENGQISEKVTLDSSGEIVDKNSYLYDPFDRTYRIEKYNGNYVEYDYERASSCPVYQYDSKKQSRISKIYDCSDHLLKQIEKYSDGSLEVTSNEFNKNGNKIKSIDSQGWSTEYQYDFLGRMIEKKTPPTMSKERKQIYPVHKYVYNIQNLMEKYEDANGHVTLYYYNARGEEIERVFPNGSKEKREYSTDGMLVKKIEPSGCYTLYQYDHLKRVVEETYYNIEGELGDCVTSVYDMFHLLSKISSQGKSAYYKYDYKGQKIVEATTPDFEGVRCEFSYDTQGRVVEKILWVSSDDWIQELLRYTPGSLLEEKKELNAQGDLLSWVSYLYNYQGKVIQEKHWIEAKKFALSTYDYDCSGCKIFEQGADGRYKRYAILLDSQNSRWTGIKKVIQTGSEGGVLEEVYNPLGQKDRFTQRTSFGYFICGKELHYDLQGKITLEKEVAIQDDGSKKTKETFLFYDNMGQIIERQEQPGTAVQKSEHYRYNKFGKCIFHLTRQGSQVLYAYDSFNRMARMYSGDGSINYLYEYDQQGRPQTIKNLTDEGYQEYFYNDQGDLIQERLKNGLMMRFEYDQIHRKKKVILPDESQIGYQYQSGNIQSVKRISEKLETLYEFRIDKYDGLGRPSEAILSGGIGVLKYHWSLSGELIGLTTPVCSFGKDHKGNLVLNSEVSEVSEVNEGEALTPRKVETQRIKEEEILRAQTHAMYDAFGRLKSIIQQCNMRINYRYDFLNRRVCKEICLWSQKEEKWQIFEKERYLWDGNQEIGIVNSEGKIQSLKIHAGKCATVALELEGKSYSALSDPRGTIFSLIDLNEKQLMETYSYTHKKARECFSAKREKISFSLTKNPWGINGWHWDVEALLWYHLEEGYFDPQIGQVITGSFNRWTASTHSHNFYAFISLFPFLNTPEFHSIWNYFGWFHEKWTGLSSTTSKFMGRYLWWNNESRQTISWIQKTVLSKAFSFLGEDFPNIAGLVSNEFKVGVKGKGEINSKVRVTWMNGILSDVESCKHAARKISELHGGTNVHYVYNPSGGIIFDIAFKAAAVKIGLTSYHSRAMAATWRRVIGEMGGPHGGGRVYHYAHSLGGTLTYNALSLLSEEERSMIHLHAFASASVIPEDACGSVQNYITYRDPIVIVDPIHYFWSYWKDSYHVQFFSKKGSSFAQDHFLLSHTSYLGHLEQLGKNFISIYGTVK